MEAEEGIQEWLLWANERNLAFNDIYEEFIGMGESYCTYVKKYIGVIEWE